MLTSRKAEIAMFIPRLLTKDDLLDHQMIEAGQAHGRHNALSDSHNVMAS